MRLPVTLVDDQGTHWVLHRRRLDLRIIRRLAKDTATPAIWGDTGGLTPRRLTETERPTLRTHLKTAYKGPGGDWSTGRYLAREFRADRGRRMLYIEDHC